MNPISQFEMPSLARVRRVIVERRRLILGVTAAFVALGFVLSVVTPPIYRATVRVEFRRTPERSPLTGTPTGSGNFQLENVALYTSAELITNRVLLGRLAADVRTDPAYARRGHRDQGLASLLRPFVGRATAGPTGVQPTGFVTAADMEAEIRFLEKAVRVEPVRETRLVDVHVDHSDPYVARILAQRLAQLFVDYQNERMTSADTVGVGTLKARMAELRERIQAANARLSHSGYDVGAGRRVRAERYRASLSSLSQDLAAAQGRLASARSVYGNLHPKIAALEAETQALRSRVAQEESRAASAEWGVTDSRTALESELVADQELYARMVARAQEAGLEGNSSPAVVIVEPASVSPDPLRPRRGLTMLLSLLTGCLVGVGTALLGDSLRRTIYDSDDVEKLLQLPVLAEIPRTT